MPVLSFVIPGYTPEEAGDILTDSYDIICRTGLHCAPGLMKDIWDAAGDHPAQSVQIHIRERDRDRIVGSAGSGGECVKDGISV